MPDLKDDESAQVQGSARSPYIRSLPTGACRGFRPLCGSAPTPNHRRQPEITALLATFFRTLHSHVACHPN